MLVDTYITQLKSLFIDAGFATTTTSTDPAVITTNAAIDAEKIRILEKSVSNNILETIYSSDSPIPTTYDAYKDKILQLGRMREHYDFVPHRRDENDAVQATDIQATDTEEPVKILQ
jgi:hypothetical protein